MAVRSKEKIVGEDPGEKEGEALNILLAEDNPLNQKITAKLLEKKGWLVTIVKDGQGVLEQIAHKNFDVILMDVQMPGVDGFEATQRIRRREEKMKTHIPIVAITAHAMVEDEKKCLDAGMDGYLSKPIDAAKVYAVIEQVVSRFRK
jgi:CheY-like chemotaxis protein